MSQDRGQDFKPTPIMGQADSVFKRMRANHQIQRNGGPETEKTLSTKEVLAGMSGRPCRENIRQYKKDMKEFRAMLGMGSVNISHGKLAQMRDEQIQNLGPLPTQMAYEHRLLNSYLQSYQEKLSLVDNRALYFSALCSPEELCTIAIDYDELKRLTHAANETGFDPYT